MDREPCIGDRFSLRGMVIEVINDHQQMLIEDPNNIYNYKPGMVSSWSHSLSNDRWKYIGNFSKSNGFNNLYDKLNER